MSINSPQVCPPKLSVYSPFNALFILFETTGHTKTYAFNYQTYHLRYGLVLPITSETNRVRCCKNGFNIK